jgi:hypothetical protein
MKAKLTKLRHRHRYMFVFIVAVRERWGKRWLAQLSGL